MLQTWENDEKPKFGLNLETQFFFLVRFASIDSNALFQAMILCKLKENLHAKLEKMVKT